ncbi:MAG: hypothetical protein KAW12_24200 [Candidatus Aminicenantes bacterium]|nr:hypothetical protein [Candidatus Aminicenantes bacterium]
MLGENEINEIIKKFDLHKNNNPDKINFDKGSNEVVTLKLDHVTTPRREPPVRNA